MIKKGFYFFALGILLQTLTVNAAPAPETITASKLMKQGLESNRAWELVSTLTTEIGPRLAGTEADHKAVQWAKAELEQSGFDNVRLEPFSFPMWQRYQEQAKIISPYPQALRITALGYSGSTDGELEAELVTFPDLESLKKADEAQIKGKIVFVNQRMEASIDGMGYGAAVPVRYFGAGEAEKKGAVAFLIRSMGTHSHRFPHTGAMLPSNDSPLPSAALSPPDADQLERIMAQDKPIKLGLNIKASLTKGEHSWNVIAELTGREKPEEVILIGAHLDSWDLGTGALDDGAGVAIVSAAAEIIGKLPQRPRRTIRVVLFGNEEQLIRGARSYAEAHKEELHQILFASESDFGAGYIVRFDTKSAELMDAAMPLLEQLNISRGGIPLHGGPDIRPLQEKGVPVFRLLQDGTDYFDYHHTEDDTLDKINPEKLKQNVAAWTVVTFLAAELPLTN